MLDFVLCCGAGSTNLEAAAANWQALGLQQLVFGESSLQPTAGRQLLEEVPHTPQDEPCLGAILSAAVGLSAAPWLLLVAAEAHLTPTAVDNLSQLARPDHPKQLVIGRAWRLPPQRLRDLASAEDQGPWDDAIAAQGRLDPPTQFSWVLLPRDALLEAPAWLGASPEQAVPWLVDQARTLGWPVLEASSAIALLRPSAPALQLSSVRQARPPECTGVVLPHAAGAPRLSVLVAAPPEDLEGIVETLRPAVSLPWEVIVRPDLTDWEPGSTTAAWNSALADARGDLVWPLACHHPALAYFAYVLRLFDQPWVDLAQFAWRLGEHHHPADDLHRVEPGTLVAQRSWIQRLGGFDESKDARSALLGLRQKALERGALLRSVPLEVLEI